MEEFPQRPFNNSNFNEIICLAHNQPPFPPSFYIEIVKFHRQITTPFMVACTIILFHCELYGRFLITFVPINTIYSLLCINETMGAYSSFFFGSFITAEVITPKYIYEKSKREVNLHVMCETFRCPVIFIASLLFV